MQPVAGSDWRYRRLLWVGLFVMFILIGVAAVLAVTRAPTPTSTPFPFDFGWVWSLVGVVFLLWFLSFFFGGWWWRPHRYGWWVEPQDPVQILRVRYARGEITKDQYDEMMRDLARPPGPGL